MTDQIPRRARMDLWTPAERAISAAVQAVEALPADVRLTDAVVALKEAQESVADFIDGHPRRPTARAEDKTEVEQAIDRFWNYVARAYDIEDRSYFEGNPPDASVFGSPLAHAAHHLWKRDPKVEAARAEGKADGLREGAERFRNSHAPGATFYTGEVYDWLCERAEEPGR